MRIGRANKAKNSSVDTRNKCFFPFLFISGNEIVLEILCPFIPVGKEFNLKVKVPVQFKSCLEPPKWNILKS